jgi:phosphoglycerol transferase
MHIAVVNSFPCLANNAELEYIKRLLQAAAESGHRAYEVISSDDIHLCEPDFVLTTHEVTPKLTPYFTLGGLWNPPAFYEGDPRRVKAILSYDGYLVGSPQIGRFIDDLEFSTGVRKPRSNFRFLPTALRSEFEPRRADRPYELVYLGVHWDGQRHKGLLSTLSQATDINLYGPLQSWEEYPRFYRGVVAFDGASVNRTLARHGLALCFHRDERRLADTPSMRLFEAAAAGCLIIADEIPFAKRVLGDSAFYLDLRRDPLENRERVLQILRWANENREQANAMAERSHRILRDEYSIETILQRCCDFVSEAKAEIAGRQNAAVNRASAALAPSSAGAMLHPLVDIIMRTGERSLTLLQRALRSVAAQRAGQYRVILVDYKDRQDTRALVAAESTRNLPIDYLTCADTGMRSTPLWTALPLVKAPFFAMLDDDDSIMPDHLPTLLDLADRYPEHGVYYSGAVRVEEDPGDHVTAANFTGPLWIEVQEKRELVFLENFNLPRLIAFDNYILSNAWIARTSLLDEKTLIDPQIIVAEDVYLLLMLARVSNFKCSVSPTAYWYWRSSSRDNSMLKVDHAVFWLEVQKLIRRLDQELFPGGLTFSAYRQLLDRRDVGHAQSLPVLSGKVPLGTPTFFGTTIIAHARQLNLHSPEDEGVWTAAPEAHVQIRLADFVGPVRLRLLFLAAGSKARGQQVTRISVNGQEIFQSVVDPWRAIEIERDLYILPHTSVLFIRACCTYTVNPSQEGINVQEARELGVFLSSITCTRLETRRRL